MTCTARSWEGYAQQAAGADIILCVYGGKYFPGNREGFVLRIIVCANPRCVLYAVYI